MVVKSLKPVFIFLKFIVFLYSYRSPYCTIFCTRTDPPYRYHFSLLCYTTVDTSLFYHLTRACYHLTPACYHLISTCYYFSPALLITWLVIIILH